MWNCPKLAKSNSCFEFNCHTWGVLLHMCPAKIPKGCFGDKKWWLSCDLYHHLAYIVVALWKITLQMHRYSPFYRRRQNYKLIPLFQVAEVYSCARPASSARPIASNLLAKKTTATINTASNILALSTSSDYAQAMLVRRAPLVAHIAGCIKSKSSAFYAKQNDHVLAETQVEQS